MKKWFVIVPWVCIDFHWIPIAPNLTKKVLDQNRSFYDFHIFGTWIKLISGYFAIKIFIKRFGQPTSSYTTFFVYVIHEKYHVSRSNAVPIGSAAKLMGQSSLLSSDFTKAYTDLGTGAEFISVSQQQSAQLMEHPLQLFLFPNLLRIPLYCSQWPNHVCV